MFAQKHHDLNEKNDASIVPELHGALLHIGNPTLAPIRDLLEEQFLHMHRLFGNQIVKQWANSARTGVVQRMIDERTFKADAKAINPRLNPLRTSLRPVINAARRYRKQPGSDHLTAVVNAITQLPPSKANTYANALGNLQNEINNVLALWANGDFQTLLNHILGLSLSERRASRDNQLKRTQIQKRPRNEAVAVMGALMTGSLQYAQPLNGTDMFFNLFVRDRRDEELSDNATLNCWEFVMYSAYLAGSISGDQIFNYYKAENKMGTEKSYSILGWNEDLPLYNPGEIEPQIGDIMFVHDKVKNPLIAAKFPKGRFPGHVVMYIGGGDVLTHNSGQGNLAKRANISQEWPPAYYYLQYTSPSWLI